MAKLIDLLYLINSVKSARCRNETSLACCIICNSSTKHLTAALDPEYRERTITWISSASATLERGETRPATWKAGGRFIRPFVACLQNVDGHLSGLAISALSFKRETSDLA